MTKRLLIGNLIIAISTCMTAQDLSITDRHEICITATGFSTANFGMQLKTGINENTMLRIGLFNLESGFEKYNPGITNDYPENQLDLNWGMEAGLERRAGLADRLELMYGAGLICRTGFRRNHADNPNLPEGSRSLVDYYISPGIGINIGGIMKISENFLLSAELIPSLVYYHRVDEQLDGTDIVSNKTNGIDFILDSETVRLSLIFRWYDQK